MSVTRENRKRKVCKIIILGVLLAVILGGIRYFQVTSPKIIANRVREIIRADDLTQIGYLRKILTKGNENHLIFFAQLDILEYISKKKDVESVPSFIEFYKRATDGVSNSYCIEALSRIPTSDGVDFLISELNSTYFQQFNRFILDRLYEMYFSVQPEVQEKIYQAYRDNEDIVIGIQYERLILGTLQGDSECYELLRMVAQNDLRRKEFVQQLAISRINNVDIIKNNEMLMEIIRFLHETNDYDIALYTKDYF